MASACQAHSILSYEYLTPPIPNSKRPSRFKAFQGEYLMLGLGVGALN